MILDVKRVTFTYILIVLFFSSYAQIKFCAVGDVLLDRGVRTSIQENNSVLYPFEHIKSIVSENDIALFNLECPIVDSTKGYRLNKRYSFRAEPSYVEGIKWAGFNIASVANNHTIDYSKNGFLETIQILKENDINVVGGGVNQDEAFKPVLLEKEGETFAIFALLEFLLEATTFNESQPYPAFGKIDSLCLLIREYNSIVDNIIVTFHWGMEGVVIPTSRQTEYAHKVIDAGADLVIGHHPHVIQSIETYRDKLILYSLGNFVFDNSGEDQKQSVIFQCGFNNGRIIDPILIPIYIEKNRPTLANPEKTNEIFKNITQRSTVFETYFNLTPDGYIGIKYNHAYKPIEEYFINELHFEIFEHQIDVFESTKKTISYELPDSNYRIIDVCYYIEDEVVYFYSIVQNTQSNRAQIAIIPYSLRSGAFLQPSLDSHESLNPWKINVSDIDNDSIPELIVGVNKETRYDKRKENRVFVYNRDKDHIYPKWLGSKIGNPIINYKLMYNDSLRTNTLIILEQTKEAGNYEKKEYMWNGFGFDFIKKIGNAETSIDIDTDFVFSHINYHHLK